MFFNIKTNAFIDLGEKGRDKTASYDVSGKTRKPS